MAVCFDRRGRLQVLDNLDELESLAWSAGGEVVGRCIQERHRPDPSCYIGRGKAQELAERIRDVGADLAIFDDDLSPGQVRELERRLGVRVIDRSGLILDIFAERARTKEARTQVQLAQLEYLLPRLARRWRHLAGQQGGVIGMRGVGEKQIELDRRMLRRKLGYLKKDLARIETGRRQRRASRNGLPRIAVVGYTNVGKSSLVNALARAGCRVEDRLFSTLDARVRAVMLGPRARALVVDTVGFLRKLPHHLIASFRGTLEEVVEADLLLHVVDISHPAFEEHLKITRETVASLGAASRQEILVFNKVDQVDSEGLLERLRALYPEALQVSALRGDGLEALRAVLRAALWEERPAGRVSLPMSRQDLVHQVYEHVHVTGQCYRRGRVVLEYRANRDQEGRLQRALQRQGARPVGEHAWLAG
ncbi:MAG: GTPase HflX [Acidobacteriota bacterium]